MIAFCHEGCQSLVSIKRQIPNRSIKASDSHAILPDRLRQRKESSAISKIKMNEAKKISGSYMTPSRQNRFGFERHKSKNVNPIQNSEVECTRRWRLRASHYSCVSSSEKHLNQREAAQSNDEVEALVSMSPSQKTTRGD
jgi:hypothetical protein